MTVVVATIAAQRKDYSLEQCLDALNALTCSDKIIYLNYQGSPAGKEEEQAFDCIKGKAGHLDIWQWSSSWQDKPKYNQDPARLTPIILARNMALEFAVAKKASHILFVDSDVIVPPDSIEKLLEVKASVCGGVVPGRGAHSHASYIFGERMSANVNNIPVTRCNHGTMGFCMIHESVFSRIRFRSGGFNGYWNWKRFSKSRAGEFGSEDPIYAEDAEAAMLSTGWIIRRDLVAQHLDNPLDPLTDSTAAPTYNEP